MPTDLEIEAARQPIAAKSGCRQNMCLPAEARCICRRIAERALEAAERVRGSAKPDYVYDPDDWECTYPWQDRCELATKDYLDIGTVERFATLNEGPNKWAAHVVITRDEYGDPDETEIRWFDSEAEARAAVAPLPNPPAGR